MFDDDDSDDVLFTEMSSEDKLWCTWFTLNCAAEAGSGVWVM